MAPGAFEKNFHPPACGWAKISAEYPNRFRPTHENLPAPIWRIPLRCRIFIPPSFKFDALTIGFPLTEL